MNQINLQQPNQTVPWTLDKITHFGTMPNKADLDYLLFGPVRTRSVHNPGLKHISLTRTQFSPSRLKLFFYLHFSGTMHTTTHACPVTMATRDARPSPKRRQALSRSRALRRAWCRVGEWVWHDTFYWLSRSNRNTRRWNCSNSVLFFVRLVTESVPRVCTW